MTELPNEEQVKEAIRESNQDQRDLVEKVRAKSRTIKQSVYDLLNIYQPFPKLITEHKDIIDQALKEIETLLVESLPNEEEYGHKSDDFNDYAIGWNECISKTKANLLKILGGER